MELTPAIYPRRYLTRGLHRRVTNDASIPAKYRMAVPPRCLGPIRADPVVTITVSDSCHRANTGVAVRNRYRI